MNIRTDRGADGSSAVSQGPDFRIFARIPDEPSENGKEGLQGYIFTDACNQKGFNRLYDFGKKMYEEGSLSEYEIGVFADNQIFFSKKLGSNHFKSDYLKTDFMEIINEEYECFMSEDYQNCVIEMDYHYRRQKSWEDSFLSESFIKMLAMDLDEFMYDADPYEYKDQYDSREDGVNDTISCLNGSEEDWSVIENYLDDYISSHDDNEPEEIDSVMNLKNLFEMYVHSAEIDCIRKSERIQNLFKESHESNSIMSDKVAFKKFCYDWQSINRKTGAVNLSELKKPLTVLSQNISQAAQLKHQHTEKSHRKEKSEREDR